MFCHKCGEQLAEGTAFCHKCGTKIVYDDNSFWSADTSAAANEHGETNRQMQKNGTVTVKKIETGHVANSNEGDFKMFVDNHIRETTKFQSSEDLLKNSKPWRFIWACIAIPAVIGFRLGGDCPKTKNTKCKMDKSGGGLPNKRSKQHWKDINMADFDSKVENFKTTFEFSDSLGGGIWKSLWDGLWDC